METQSKEMPVLLEPLVGEPFVGSTLGTAGVVVKELARYYIANKTLPRHYDTSNGLSKQKEYLQIEGCPCMVVNYNNETDRITLNSFTSALNRNFTISSEELDNDFTKLVADSDGYLNVPNYSVSIHESEFDKRKNVKDLEKQIKEVIKNPKIKPELRKVFEDKLFQLMVSQGAPYITIKEYEQYKNQEIILSNKHKRFGNEIFNRNNRWCPPVDVTYEEYQKSPSYPAPLGIRPKDFCLPSELINTMEELIIQIMNFDGVDDESFQEAKKILPFINKKKHVCKYCGGKINIGEYSSEYKSCENYIEICHRDPNDRFLARNMYWGHGDCNRRQGGYSEKDRINDGVRLMLLNEKSNEEGEKKSREICIDGKVFVMEFKIYEK
jgi:hypothetical protein